MAITTIGLDLAKNIFQVHGVDEAGTVVLRRTLRRAQVAPFFGQLAPCAVGMESCSTSQYWARKLSAVGHDARLIPPQFVVARSPVAPPDEVPTAPGPPLPNEKSPSVMTLLPSLEPAPSSSTNPSERQPEVRIAPAVQPGHVAKIACGDLRLQSVRLVP